MQANAFEHRVQERTRVRRRFAAITHDALRDAPPLRLLAVALPQAAGMSFDELQRHLREFFSGLR